MILFIVYRTINKVNNKIYVGVHKTNNLNDEYLGSGEILLKAINKYGRENFRREIINTYTRKKDAYNLEKLIVNKSFIRNQNTYNIRLGGYGGDGGPEVNKKISKATKGRSAPWNKSKSFQQKRVKAMYDKYGKNAFSSFEGKNHTPETIIKMKESQKGKHNGKLNSQFGTCWIYSLSEKTNKKIKVDDLSIWLSKGWIKGRKMSF